eukprot:GILK01005440.1.p1 GENE.GILK01005440.1~~GILK01005440.1.p1  ORF type:complete len:745 (+),score=77.11 GILK01005440.1:81-2237(+)
MAATTATITVLGLPTNPATEINYCPGGRLDVNTHLHTEFSRYTYTSGAGCVLGAGRLLNMTAEPLQYWEPNNTAPATAIFADSSVEAGGAVYLRAPDFGFVDLMVPWVVRITNNNFALNAVVHFHGCLPKDSQVTISGNVFEGNNALNNAIYQNGYIASISAGVLDSEFTNPLHFGIRSEFVIADNVIKGVTGALGQEASGVRVIPASFFLADHSRMVVRNNSVAATGVDTNPGIPFNIKGYINVIPEYNGTTNVTFEFSNNVATATKGIAWWLPGLWGPRGARNLNMIITGNSGTVDNVVNNDKWAAIQSVVNCTGEGHLTFEGNSLTVLNSEANFVFYEQTSEDATVRISNNKFDVRNGNARFNVMRWETAKHGEISGNEISSSADVVVQIFGITGSDMTGGLSGNTFSGATVSIAMPLLSVNGGSFISEDNTINSRNAAFTLNLQSTNLTGGASAHFRRWTVTAYNAITFSLPNALNVEDSQLHIQDMSFTTSLGDAIIYLPAFTLNGNSLLNISGNQLNTRGGSPHLRFSGNVAVEGDSAIHITFNNFYRADTGGSITMPFVYAAAALSLGNDAQFGVWNNTFDARNSTNFVGMVTVAGAVSVENDTAVNICDNRYFIVTNQTLILMVVTPALANVVNCVDYLPTAPATTTTTDAGTNTTQAENATSGDATVETTTLDPNGTTTEPFDGNNGAPTASMLVGTLAAVVVASLLAL